MVFSRPLEDAVVPEIVPNRFEPSAGRRVHFFQPFDGCREKGPGIFQVSEGFRAQAVERESLKSVRAGGIAPIIQEDPPAFDSGFLMDQEVDQ